MILIMKILLHNEYKIINLRYPTYVYQFLIFLIITKIECWPVFKQDPKFLISISSYPVLVFIQRYSYVVTLQRYSYVDALPTLFVRDLSVEAVTIIEVGDHLGASIGQQHLVLTPHLKKKMNINLNNY